MREAALGVVLALACAACSGSPPLGEEEGGVTTDPSGTATVSTSGSSSVTSATLTSDPTNETEDPPDPTDDPWVPDLPDPPEPDLPEEPGPDLSTNGIPDQGDPTTGGDPGDPSCSEDLECDSGYCYVLPVLGGTCGDCSGDIDCVDGGCQPPNPFTSEGSYCNEGGLGDGCESNEVCAPGLSCETSFDLDGIIEINSCSECANNGWCEPMQLCAPIVELDGFVGHRACIEPGTMPLDSYCDLGQMGDAACESGICASVDVMGLAEIGVCGQCNTDADCQGGSCVPGELVVDTGQLIGSVCL